MTMTPEAPTIAAQDILSELQQLTESAAIAVGPWIGRNDKLAADGAAVDSLATSLSSSQHIRYNIAINEGVKDQAPHLPHGSVFGESDGPIYDFAADPVEGTARVAAGRAGGMVLAAVAPHGTFPVWADIRYMRKFVVGPEAATNMQIGNYMSITNDPREVMAEVAAALSKPRTELRVAVLDRERNRHIIDAIEAIGAKAIKLDSGDVLPALQACIQEQDRVDMLYGSGGAPETILTAAAVAGLGGNMQAMWDPNPDGTAPEEMVAVEQLDQRGMVLTLEHMIGKDPESVFFAASGITDSPVLDGVKRRGKVWTPGTSIAVQGKPYPRY